MGEREGENETRDRKSRFFEKDRKHNPHTHTCTLYRYTKNIFSGTIDENLGTFKHFLSVFMKIASVCFV